MVLMVLGVVLLVKPSETRLNPVHSGRCSDVKQPYDSSTFWAGLGVDLEAFYVHFMVETGYVRGYLKIPKIPPVNPFWGV